MKPQDILFFLILIALTFFRKPQWFVVAGIVSLAIAMPLFAKHIFFTAQHLTYYAWGFFLVAVLFIIYENRN